ncbi:MAG: hypothetical protein K2Y37_06800 [Pirellulales bacterium]|nr:hypothetical protein [Pirellulales bacterium]
MSPLDAGQRSEILGLISLGCSQVVAARVANCSLADVQQAFEQDPDLFKELAAAASELETRALKAIEDAWGKNWRAACWLLERRFPERYARRPPDTIPVEEARKFLTDVSALVEEHLPDDPAREQLLTALAERGRELHLPERRRKP